ncbi:LOW QUALITY PROTEIN: mitochondrial import inner membrane translocase subunit Tim29 [Columba livia]|uniref:LOW QUALITY PROTEIN: mitochondrial import inner membrane translocase subunit Tim29 n=1 Tax=Columba livia TaxID=8932 RepID=UPI0031BA341B
MATGGTRGVWGRFVRSRVGRWFGSVLHDYAAAASDVTSGARRRPGAAALTVSSVAAAGAAAATVPSAESFDAAALDAAAALGLLSPGTRSPDADRHVQRLLRRRATGRLRYRDLVLAAVVYESPRAAGAAAYAQRCRYLRARWWEAPRRLLDVGFLGRWWVLRWRCRDYDVNEREFAALPERLRRLRRHQLRSHPQREGVRRQVPARGGAEGGAGR